MENYDTLEFLAELEKGELHSSNNDELVPPGERLCPICSEAMIVEVEYGVHVDVCPQHGIWLDRGELLSMASFIRSGERIDRVRAVKNARRQGKLSGTVFGAWSLMFD